MIITAKSTKLTCFVNTVLQPCLILDKLFIFVAYDPSAHFNAIILSSPAKSAWHLSALAN